MYSAGDNKGIEQKKEEHQFSQQTEAEGLMLFEMCRLGIPFLPTTILLHPLHSAGNRIQKKTLGFSQNMLNH